MTHSRVSGGSDPLNKEKKEERLLPSSSSLSTSLLDNEEYTWSATKQDSLLRTRKVSVIVSTEISLTSNPNEMQFIELEILRNFNERSDRILCLVFARLYFLLFSRNIFKFLFLVRRNPDCLVLAGKQ